VSILYCKLARLLGISRRWIIVSCVVLAAMAAIPTFWYVRFSDVPGKNLWVFGIGFPPHIQQLGQCIVPLVIGWWFLRRTRGQGRLQLAS